MRSRQNGGVPELAANSPIPTMGPQMQNIAIQDRRPTLVSWLLLLILCVVTAVPLAHADQTKANNTNNLELGSSWVSGVAPAGTDNAIWNATVSVQTNCTNTLGAAVTWNSIVISDPVDDITLNGNNGTLTLNNGINMSGAAVNYNLNCGTTTLGAGQVWNVASNYTLTTGSATTRGRVQNNTITKNGGGTWTAGGTDDNGSLGIIINAGMVNLNKTSTSGVHCVGGGGLVINPNGTARITGSGGDQIYNPANVTIAGGAFDLNGNAETISHLYFNSGTLEDASGSGSLTATAGVVLGSTNCVFEVAAGASMTILGPVSGSYSVKKIDLGTLVLSGTNTYSGATTISAGQFLGGTGGSCSNSAVTVNSGSTNGILFMGGNSQWTCGSLVYGAGITYAVFNFGANLPSLGTAPLQVDGNLSLNGTLNVIILGSVIPTGVYQLVKYTGTLAGVVPNTVYSLPEMMTATIVNNTANNSIDLNVATGNIAAQINWGGGNGIWDVNTTSNWNNRIGSPVVYQNGNGVIFDDTASGG